LVLLFLGSLAFAQESHKLIAGTDDTPAANAQNALFCNVANGDPGYDSCQWTMPDGTLLTLRGGEVLDEDGLPVPGIVDDSRLGECRIAVTNLQTGKWECKVEVTGVSEYQVAAVNAIEEPRVDNVRLGDELLPLEYDVELVAMLTDLDEFNAALLDGLVRMRADVLERSNIIRMHTKDQTIYEDTVLVSVNGDAFPVEGFGYDDDRQFFDIYVRFDLLPRDSLEVEFSYLGHVRNDLAGDNRNIAIEGVNFVTGFYTSVYQEDGEDQVLALTQIQSTDARKVRVVNKINVLT